MKPEEAENFGEILRSRRVAMGLPRRRAASFIGVDESALERWEIRHCRMPFLQVYNLIRALGGSMHVTWIPLAPVTEAETAYLTESDAPDARLALPARKSVRATWVGKNPKPML